MNYHHPNAPIPTEPSMARAALRFMCALYAFALYAFACLYLAPYAIWWVGALSIAAWIVPTLVANRAALGIWVGLALFLTYVDINHHTHYVIAWLLGIAYVAVLVIPLDAAITIGKKLYRSGQKAGAKAAVES